jgi:hypothetical protein
MRIETLTRTTSTMTDSTGLVTTLQLLIVMITLINYYYGDIISQ